MVHLRRGEGGPPTPSPPRAPWGLSLIGSLASHGTLCFSIKNHRPISSFTLMDDPVLSPEAQQGILMKRNTHQNGTLIVALMKMEHSVQDILLHHVVIQLTLTFN